MGYEIHLTRPDGQPGVTLAEWLATVATSPAARIMTAPLELGQGLTLAPGPGDVELFVMKEQRWVAVFFCTVLDSGEAQIHTGAKALALPEALTFLRHANAMLNSIVTGDEGEEYDVVTGDVIE